MTTSGISWGRHWLKLIAFIALLLLPAPATAHAETAPDLTIFFSSDTRGMLRRCGCSEGQEGGLSARASYIKANRIPGKTLVLDAGDTLFDGPDVPQDMREFYALKARTMFKAMKAAGYDAVAVGEYDLAYGERFLAGAAKANGFTLLSANLREKGVQPFKAALIKRFTGISAGVIGMVDDAFPYGSFPQHYSGIAIADPARSARAETERLAKKADVVIVLAHLSVTDAITFTKQVSGADIVIQGHSQEELDKPIVVGNTLLVKGFYLGKKIGRLDLWFNKDKSGRIIKVDGKKIRDYKYSVITLDESIPPDPEVESIIADYRQKLKEKSFAFGRPGPEGAGRYAGSDKCRSCHAKEFSNWSVTKHAQAFDALIKTGDQYDPECLQCHTTGYGFASGYPAGGEKLKNVTCEDCHGRGSAHVESGAKMPAAVAEKTCRGCHDDYQSPDFEFEKYKAMGGAHRGR